MSTIEDRVKMIIEEQLSVTDADMKPETTFADLGGDSLDHVEIIMELEMEFEIDIDDTEAEAIKTVQQAIDYITKRVEV